MFVACQAQWLASRASLRCKRKQTEQYKKLVNNLALQSLRDFLFFAMH